MLKYRLHCCLNYYRTIAKGQVEYITSQVKTKLTEVLLTRQKQLIGKKRELEGVNNKISRLEEGLMTEEITGETYKKWYRKFPGEKALIQAQIDSLNKGSGR